MTSEVVRVTNLSVVYPGGERAVDSIDLTVHAGEVLGLIGGNGAGKSTTMKALAGALPATGQVLIGGHDMTNRKSSNAGRRELGYCPDVGGLPQMATVREVVGVTLAATGAHGQWDRAMGIAERLGLMPAWDKPIDSFSKGMSRKTSVLAAILASRSVLILDEPFDGVDPVGSAVVTELVREAADAGVAVILSTHLMDHVAVSCDRVAVMAHGKVVDTARGRSLRSARGRRKYKHLLEIS